MPHVTALSTGADSFFSATKRIPSDAIFALTAQYFKDPFPNKVNLGQGTYRDEHGQPWVLPSVKRARRILEEGGLNHEYLPILGLPDFRRFTSRAVLGRDAFQSLENRIATCQSLSGTGALHLAALLLRKCRSPMPKVYVPEPTWSNHFQVFESVGFKCEKFAYYDKERRAADISSYLGTLRAAEPGSVVIMHACAHNPTGCDPSEEEWREIGRVMKSGNLFPVFDSAYLGFNSGSFDKDAFAIRHFIDELRMEAIVCVSFAKNMGLYGERTGLVMVASSTEETAGNCTSMLEQLQRSEVSNPPAYGAKIAELILSDTDLFATWQEDLVTMSSRIRDMRQTLYDHLLAKGASGDWSHITAQSGMFGFLGLSPDIVRELKEKHHIYMADNSRISMAGLNESNVAYVASAISKCLRAKQ